MLFLYYNISDRRIYFIYKEKNFKKGDFEKNYALFYALNTCKFKEKHQKLINSGLYQINNE